MEIVIIAQNPCQRVIVVKIGKERSSMNEIERAIESTKNRIHYITVNSENGTPSHCVKAEKQIEIQNVILDALEKQIPRKAEYHHKADGDCALIICPNCENRLTVAKYIFPLDRYCKECGQYYTADVKDWSVEEIQAEQKKPKTKGDVIREMNN